MAFMWKADTCSASLLCTQMQNKNWHPEGNYEQKLKFFTASFPFRVYLKGPKLNEKRTHTLKQVI